MELSDRQARATFHGGRELQLAAKLSNALEGVKWKPRITTAWRTTGWLGHACTYRRTVLSGRDAGEADARQALALAVNKPVGDVVRVMSGGAEQARYAHLYPRAHPGTRAPLGWALSEATQDDLTSQLAPNSDVMETIRDRWLTDGALRCERDAGR